MELHSLDTGLPRFLQTSITVFVRGNFVRAKFPVVFGQLLDTWPILKSRMNLMRTGLMQTSDTASFWSEKVIDNEMTAYVSLVDLNNGELTNKQRRAVEDLLQTSRSLMFWIYPPVIHATFVFFNDGWMTRFTVQHPFSDATGLTHIAMAFTSLLRGDTVEPWSPRPTKLLLKPSRAEQLQGTENDLLASQLLQATRDCYVSGWPGALSYSFLQRLFRDFRRRNPRRRRTMHISGSSINHLLKYAKQMNLKASRHDILMAFIFLATMKAFPGPPHGRNANFSFILNVNDLLHHAADVHNPWWPVTIPRPNVRSQTDLDKDLVLIAVHIRQAMKIARSADCTQELLEHYEALGQTPIRPRSLNPHAASIVVSSTSHIPVYYLPVPTEDGEDAFPCFIESVTRMCDGLSLLGLSLHDLITTWADRDNGFYFNGSLHRELWGELEQLKLHLSSSVSEKPEPSVKARL